MKIKFNKFKKNTMSNNIESGLPNNEAENFKFPAQESNEQVSEPEQFTESIQETREKRQHLEGKRVASRTSSGKEIIGILEWGESMWQMACEDGHTRAVMLDADVRPAEEGEHMEEESREMQAETPEEPREPESNVGEVVTLTSRDASKYAPGERFVRPGKIGFVKSIDAGANTIDIISAPLTVERFSESQQKIMQWSVDSYDAESGLFTIIRPAVAGEDGQIGKREITPEQLRTGK